MKRYIEIVMDNSGSMSTAMASGQSRLETAKELFHTEILPNLDFLEDTVVLRTLRTGCEGMSNAQTARNKASLEDYIRQLRPFGGTPLYNTVKDALNACRLQPAGEKIIFVLTDGEDTCGFSEHLNFTDEEMRFVKSLNVILIKYAIQNPVTNTNLDWFASKIGARTYSVGATGRTDFSSMRADFRTGLGNAGIIRGGVTINPNPAPDYSLTWEELKNRGVLFYQAELLYSEGFLSWKPKPGENLDGKAWSELLFLWSLRFGNGLPPEIVRTMLSGLKKPYAYSQSGVYWDFEKTRWIAPEPKPLQRLPNPEAEKDDLPERNRNNREVMDVYEENEYYEVEMLPQDNVAGTPGYRLVRWNNNLEIRTVPPKNKLRKLKEGDIVQFVRPKPRGRKKKGV